MTNLNNNIQPSDQDEWIQLSYRKIFFNNRKESNSNLFTEIYYNQILAEAASKRSQELMACLMPFSVINQIQSEVAKIRKMLEGTQIQSHTRDSYDLPEAANYLSIGKSTLRKALSEKEIIGDRVGRKWRFTKVQLDNYIRRGKSDAEIDSEVENTILSNKRKRK